MFKLAKQKAAAARTTKSPGFLLNPAIRGIRAPHINPDSALVDGHLHKFYDVWTKIEGRTGTVFLNKEHRYNTLSPSFCREVSRGVSSMYEDRLTRAMIMLPENGKHWSNGTDFRTILHMKKEGSYERLAEYLQQIY